ncbi:Cytosol aminopeptidase, catalytic domain [Gonapodya sp. JEL0774]|nr:Cytosol aminopeptidase, catalytic domain [Gonapodya sp. JEL0774]
MPAKLSAFSTSSPIQLVSASYDSLLVPFHSLQSVLLGTKASAFAGVLGDVQKYSEIDPIKQVTVIRSESAPGKRIILSPVGSLYGDVDDVRAFAPPIRAAVRRAINIGSRRPLILLAELSNFLNNSGAPDLDYSKALQVSVLAALQEAYVPLQAREWRIQKGQVVEEIDEIGVVDVDASVLKKLAAVEEGLSVARDLTSGDPERLTPLRCAEYIQSVFATSKNVTVTVEKGAPPLHSFALQKLAGHTLPQCWTDIPTLLASYPLLHAVARASLVVPRHLPCVVKIEYRSPKQESVEEDLFLVGKGVTFDTGGADIKAGGHMRGMSRDKGGASAVAGFLRTVSLLTPSRVNVTATLGFVRNSVGAECYTGDEIIESRAGKRVLVANTDAEGRFVMADLLAAALETALQLPNPSTARLFTVATLTGHAIRAYGSYPICMDNGPARQVGVGKRLQDEGEKWGQPFEMSRVRRDDFEYTHLDIAGAAEEGAKGLSLGKPTGAPVTVLSAFAGMLD